MLNRETRRHEEELPQRCRATEMAPNQGPAARERSTRRREAAGLARKTVDERRENSRAVVRPPFFVPDTRPAMQADRVERFFSVAQCLCGCLKIRSFVSFVVDRR